MQRVIGYQPVLWKLPAPISRLAVFLCLLLAIAPSSLALEPIDITGAEDSLSLGPHIEYLEDPDRTLELSDVRALGEQFSRHTGRVLNAGYTSAGQ